MYSLLVTKLEKMVDPTVWENPWGFFRDQGTLSWQLEPNRTRFSSRCRSWRFLDRVSWRLRGNSQFSSLGIYFYSPSGFPELKFANCAHIDTHVGDANEARIQKWGANSVHKQGFCVRVNYDVWLQVQSIFLADDDRQRHGATQWDKENRWFNCDNHTQVVTFVLYQALVME